jgi:pimeloyl-ACP methyl ester carboxylesterase
MVATYVIERACSETLTCELAFAGDGVRLAGQMDYPATITATGKGHPLLFTLPHVGWNTRQDGQHYARTALNVGFAVFRWDRRGTGRSGAGGWGSTLQDAINAYDTALVQPHIDTSRVVILAQAESTQTLAEQFGLFARLGRPAGVVLVSNRLDASAITALDVPIYILQGEEDWYDCDRYVRSAVKAHQQAYSCGAQYYIAPRADNDMMINQRENRVFHLGAVLKLQEWLKTL